MTTPLTSGGQRLAEAQTDASETEGLRAALLKLANCAEAAVKTDSTCVAEWLDADAESARQNDPEVGIFGNEDMAEVFEALGALVENIAPMGTTLARELRALSALAPARGQAAAGVGGPLDKIASMKATIERMRVALHESGKARVYADGAIAAAEIAESVRLHCDWGPDAGPDDGLSLGGLAVSSAVRKFADKMASAALATPAPAIPSGSVGEEGGLSPNWLAENLASVDAETARWSPGIRASFEATHGSLATQPTPPKVPSGSALELLGWRPWIDGVAHPSVQEIIRAHYEQGHAEEEAARLARLYLGALEHKGTTQPPQAPVADAAGVEAALTPLKAYEAHVAETGGRFLDSEFRAFRAGMKLAALTPPQAERLGECIAPAPGTEEWLFWLEAAVQHGFEETEGEGSKTLYSGDESAVIRLLLEARKQGRADVLAPAPRAERLGKGVERVRHVKRGTEYEVLGEAEAQVSEAPGLGLRKGDHHVGPGLLARHLHDGCKLTVYREPKSGKLWCRFTDEMRDGRFVTLPAPVQTDAGGGR